MGSVVGRTIFGGICGRLLFTVVEVEAELNEVELGMITADLWVS